MGPGVEGSGKHSYRQHQEVQWHTGSLAKVWLFGCCRNMFVTCPSPNSDKKRKLDGGNAKASNGAPEHGKLKKKEMQTGKFKKSKDKHGKFGKRAWQLHWQDGVWEQRSINMICNLENFGLTCKYRREEHPKDRMLSFFVWYMMCATLCRLYQQKITHLRLLQTFLQTLFYVFPF